jgi:hypothetical protein
VNKIIVNDRRRDSSGKTSPWQVQNPLFKSPLLPKEKEKEKNRRKEGERKKGRKKKKGRTLH